MKRIQVLAIFIALVGVLAIAHQASSDKYLTCQVSYRTDKQLHVGSQVLKAEVPSNAADRQKGLGGRACIGEDQAMLFESDQPVQQGIWMKGMRFPIDIVWLDVNQHVIKLQSNVQPDTYPTVYSSTEPSLYVLELQAGRAAELGLKKGSVVSF